MGEPAPALRSKVVIALCLCLAAGCVDAVGYLTLDKLLLANMSGNAVRFAVNGIKGEWSHAFVGLWAIAMFVCGLVLSALLYGVCARRHVPALRWILLLEVVLLGGFLVIGRRVVTQGGSLAPPGVSFHLLIGLGALAMGMQNASLRRVEPFSVFTTHITGTLTRFGESFAELVFWVRERRQRQPPVSWWELSRLGRKEEKVHEVFFMGGLWLMFLLGAVGGAVLQRHFGLFALLAPMAVILAIAIYDELHPINPRGES